MNALVSIVIPVYRAEAFLERCVRSLRAQTYRELEILLVDDGSPDGSGALCNRLAAEDPRIRAYHKENGGAADSRNYGAVRAAGEYIAFVDADDYVSPAYIAYLAALIEKYGADIACCGFCETADGEAPLSPAAAEEASRELSGREACAALFSREYGRQLLVPWCKLCRREIVLACPFPAVRRYEDTATLHKYLYRAEKVVLGPSRLYAYCRNPQGLMGTRGAEKSPEAIRALTERAEFFEARDERELARLAWGPVVTYLLEDSQAHGGRCDAELRQCLRSRRHRGFIATVDRLRGRLWLSAPGAFPLGQRLYARLRGPGSGASS